MTASYTRHARDLATWRDAVKLATAAAVMSTMHAGVSPRGAELMAVARMCVADLEYPGLVGGLRRWTARGIKARGQG